MTIMVVCRAIFFLDHSSLICFMLKLCLNCSFLSVCGVTIHEENRDPAVRMSFDLLSSSQLDRKRVFKA